jgi:hypothetical protein
MSWTLPNYFQSKMGYVMLDTSIIGCAQSYSLDATRSISEVQCIGSDSVRKVAGPYNWNVSFDALQILTQDGSSGLASYDEAMSKFKAGTDVSVYLLPLSTEVSTGQVYHSGRGLIESISLSVAAGEAPASYSVSIQGSGDLYEHSLA